MNALRIFYHLVVRDALRHPVLTLINILSVALGVAVYLAIQVTNYSANRALAASVDVTAGRANPVGVGENDVAIFPRLCKLPGCIPLPTFLSADIPVSHYSCDYPPLVIVFPLSYLHS